MPVILLLIPSQLVLGKLFSKFRKKTAALTDKRVKVMNEIISGIRIIKLYCWEKPFGRLVENIRRLEVKQLRRTKSIQACVMGPFFAASQVSMFLLSLIFVVTGQEADIRPGNVFLVMGVVQCLRLSCGLQFPLAAQHLAEALIGVDRLQRFLLLDELEKATEQHHTAGHVGVADDLSVGGQKQKLDCGVELINVTAKWHGTSAGSSTLEDITVSVRSGNLLA
ncbi:hypothetical protein EGW08_023191, partial [Elysia chlorotica]